MKAATRAAAILLVLGGAGAVMSSPALAARLPVKLYDDPVQQVNPWKYLTGTESLVRGEAVGGSTKFEHADTLLLVPSLEPKLRPVGRFEIKRRYDDTKTFGADFCTAWLVDRNIAITNNHCLSGEGPGVDRFVEGRVRFGAFGEGEKGAVFKVLKVLEQSDTYDFALLQLEGAPGDAFGKISLNVREAIDKEPLIVVGHPSAYPLMAMRANCYSWRPAVTEGDLHHHCDTLGGSSGSAVFAERDGRVVGLHYFGAVSDDYNLAKSMDVVVEHSPTLRNLRIAAAAAPPPTPAPAPTADQPAAATAGEAFVRDGLAAEAAKDYPAALAAFQKARAAGSPIAAGYIGRVYAEQKQYAEARNWYRQASDAGDPRGHAGLGYLLDYGLGAGEAPSEAIPFYEKAVAADFAPAQYFLGRLYEPGSDRQQRGLAKDMPRAVDLFRRAAAQGYALASYELGRIYAAGLGGVPADKAQARKFMEQAARTGMEPARTWLQQNP